MAARIDPTPDRAQSLDLTRDGLPVPRRAETWVDEREDYDPEDDDFDLDARTAAYLPDVPARAFGEAL